MVRVYQTYRDYNKNAEFKFLHVFTHIKNCKKWADTRSMVAKGGVYNPVAPVPGAAEGHPELGQKAAKSVKLMRRPNGFKLLSRSACPMLVSGGWPPIGSREVKSDSA